MLQTVKTFHERQVPHTFYFISPHRTCANIITYGTTILTIMSAHRHQPEYSRFVRQFTWRRPENEKPTGFIRLDAMLHTQPGLLTILLQSIGNTNTNTNF